MVERVCLSDQYPIPSLAGESIGPLCSLGEVVAHSFFFDKTKISVLKIQKKGIFINREPLRTLVHQKVYAIMCTCGLMFK